MAKNTSETAALVLKVEQLKKAGDQMQLILDSLSKDLQNSQSDPTSIVHHSHIPDVINRYRLEHKMNKGDLALLAGVTPNTLVKLNKDHATMRVDTLLSILESLGLTLYVGPVDG